MRLIRSLFPICLFLFVFCGNAAAQRFQLDPPATSATTGKALKWAAAYDNERVYRAQRLTGRLLVPTSEDKVVYLFLTENAEDSVKVDALLQEFSSPVTWQGIVKGEYGLQYNSLFDHCAYEEIPVTDDGMIIISINEAKNKCMYHLNLVDVNGNLLMRRPIWMED